MEQLKELKALQQTQEWKSFSSFLFSYVMNNKDYGVVAEWQPIRGENPAFAAQNNELFRKYGDGMLRVLSIVDEEYFRTEQALKDLKNV